MGAGGGKFSTWSDPLPRGSVSSGRFIYFFPAFHDGSCDMCKGIYVYGLKRGFNENN